MKKLLAGLAAGIVLGSAGVSVAGEVFMKNGVMCLKVPQGIGCGLVHGKSKLILMTRSYIAISKANGDIFYTTPSR